MLIEDFLNEYIDKPVIVHAGTFREASGFIISGETSFDVILLDLTLPDKSGQILVDDILAIVSNSPVIILTGFPDIEFSMKSISLGISDYLLKDDLNAPGLYKSILYTIERKRYVNAIEKQNKQLQEIAYIQSHIARAPLARMMGIVNIIKDIEMPGREREIWISNFNESAEELDALIHDIVRRTEQIS